MQFATEQKQPAWPGQKRCIATHLAQLLLLFFFCFSDDDLFAEVTTCARAAWCQRGSRKGVSKAVAKGVERGQMGSGQQARRSM